MSESPEPLPAPHRSTAPLDDAVARVQQALDAHGTGLHVQILTRPTDTAAAAASAVGCELGQIVKCMLFMADGGPVLLLIAGDRRLDTGRLALLLGVPRKRIRMATPDEVLTLTGFAIGAVSPIGHPRRIETLVDASLSRFKTVYPAAGSVHAIFATDPDLLVLLCDGRTAEISG